MNEKKPVLAVVIAKYNKIREREIDVEEGDIVEVVDSDGSHSCIKLGSQLPGWIPTSCLAFASLPGESLADQIKSRREWLAAVEGKQEVRGPNPLSEPKAILEPEKQNNHYFPLKVTRPIIISPLEDISLTVGESLLLSVLLYSPTPFTTVWRGPAIQNGRAELAWAESLTSLRIASAVPSDAGIYSLVTRSSLDTSTTHCFVRVSAPPPSPSGLRFRQTGPFAGRLKWTPVEFDEEPCLYLVEYTRDGMTGFVEASSGLSVHHISIRGFRVSSYRLRVIAYLGSARSPPSEELSLDFHSLAFSFGALSGKGKDLINSDSESDSDALTRSTLF